jgi:hypothetical protein
MDHHLHAAGLTAEGLELELGNFDAHVRRLSSGKRDEGRLREGGSRCAQRRFIAFGNLCGFASTGRPIGDEGISLIDGLQQEPGELGSGRGGLKSFRRPPSGGGNGPTDDRHSHTGYQSHPFHDRTPKAEQPCPARDRDAPSISIRQLAKHRRDKPLRLKGFDVLRRFPDPHELDRDVRGFLDRDDDPALGRAVEL